MEFKPKILSYCFLKRYKDYIGEFGHNSQKLSELLLTLQRHFGEITSKHPLRSTYNNST